MFWREPMKPTWKSRSAWAFEMLMTPGYSFLREFRKMFLVSSSSTESSTWLLLPGSKNRLSFKRGKGSVVRMSLVIYDATIIFYNRMNLPRYWLLKSRVRWHSYLLVCPRSTSMWIWLHSFWYLKLQKKFKLPGLPVNWVTFWSELRFNCCLIYIGPVSLLPYWILTWTSCPGSKRWPELSMPWR